MSPTHLPQQKTPASKNTPLVNSNPSHANRLLQKSLKDKLLAFYDSPHPLKPNTTIYGYDKTHARRTASLCIAVATQLGYSSTKIRQYEIACLLHDLGRTGLDPKLFGRIWSWANQQHIPTRPREWRSRYPQTLYGKETEAFLEVYGKDLERQGISLDAWTTAQIEMRLGFARRLKKQLKAVKPQMITLGIVWAPWMELVMLYYYYPEKLSRASQWVRQLAEILVACEQLEAYSNRRRGKDYYARSHESLQDAFQYLEGLRIEGIISEHVLTTIQLLMSRKSFSKILTEARGKKFTHKELRYIHQLQKASIPCQS